MLILEHISYFLVGVVIGKLSVNSPPKYLIHYGRIRSKNLAYLDFRKTKVLKHYLYNFEL